MGKRSQKYTLVDAVVRDDIKGASNAIADGADPNGTVHGARPLVLAAMFASSDMVELLLKMGAVPDQADQVGRTALHYAALGCGADRAAAIKAVNALIQAGANVNALDAGEATPLDLAVGIENKKTAAALLAAAATCHADRGSWVQQVSGVGPTPPMPSSPRTSRSRVSPPAGGSPSNGPLR